ncbi:glutaminyl-peptide cyclotransferase [Deltaproteobacteria bacterium OttesenSCG-928-M10]|nr:glutaminyl-peptide cyclotransferase [Deltaproteobacteria bacterium OttesenSCG-928-M10]
MKTKTAAIFFLAVLTLWGFPAQGGAAPLLPLELTEARPHDQGHYTQGLFFYRGRLFESAGRYGLSRLAKYDFAKGRPPELIKKYDLPEQYFAEGAAVAADEIYLLTWREETGFVLDPATLMLKRKFSYEGEGWGLAWDGVRLWRSDGSSRLFPHLPGEFAPAGPALTVRDGDREIDRLNELEWDPATGLMLANVYGRDLVAAIDLENGQVRFWLDARPLRGLAEKAGLAGTGQPYDVVLNGLALDGDGLWLTGKLWPRLYRATWPPAEAPPAVMKDSIIEGER